MTVWRAVLVAGVMALVGFVGGVWFVSTGLAFRWVRTPAVGPVAGTGPVTYEVRPSVIPATPARARAPQVEAVDVPPWWNISGGGSVPGRLAERADLMPSPGCSWEIPPRELRLEGDWHRSNVERILIGVPSLDPRSKRLRYHLTQLTRTKATPLELRAVLFDAAGNRFVARVSPEGYSSGLGEALHFSRHDWDDLPPLDDPGRAFFGVERVVPEAARLAATAARAEAQAKGVELMPSPRLGEPFSFDLATVDGRRVRSADLKGRAILIVFHGPFPRQPFPLTQVRKEIPEADLAVVGVSFDGDAATATRDWKQIGEPAPLVLVPNDVAARRLWREGVELPYLPAYWIVDRDGILRFQEQWFDLPDRLATVTGHPTQRGKFEALAKEARTRPVGQAYINGVPVPMPARPAPSAPGASPRPKP